MAKNTNSIKEAFDNIRNSYSEKLKHPKWQRKRLEIMQRDYFTCKLCGDTENELHVHHEKYDGEPWEIASEFLYTLCSDCHNCIHIINQSIVYDLKNTRAFKRNYNDGKLLILMNKKHDMKLILAQIDANTNNIVGNVISLNSEQIDFIQNNLL